MAPKPKNKWILISGSRFVLISTDMAVTPVNIMGAIKYLCELVGRYEGYRWRGKPDEAI